MNPNGDPPWWRPLIKRCLIRIALGYIYVKTAIKSISKRCHYLPGVYTVSVICSCDGILFPPYPFVCRCLSRNAIGQECVSWTRSKWLHRLRFATSIHPVPLLPFVTFYWYVLSEDVQESQLQSHFLQRVMKKNPSIEVFYKERPFFLAPKELLQKHIFYSAFTWSWNLMFSVKLKIEVPWS